MAKTGRPYLEVYADDGQGEVKFLCFDSSINCVPGLIYDLELKYSTEGYPPTIMGATVIGKAEPRRDERDSGPSRDTLIIRQTCIKAAATLLQLSGAGVDPVQYARLAIEVAGEFELYILGFKPEPSKPPSHLAQYAEELGATPASAMVGPAEPVRGRQQTSPKPPTLKDLTLQAIAKVGVEETLRALGLFRLSLATADSKTVDWDALDKLTYKPTIAKLAGELQKLIGGTP